VRASGREGLVVSADAASPPQRRLAPGESARDRALAGTSSVCRRGGGVTLDGARRRRRFSPEAAQEGRRRRLALAAAGRDEAAAEAAAVHGLQCMDEDVDATSERVRGRAASRYMPWCAPHRADERHLPCGGLMLCVALGSRVSRHPT